MDKILRFLYRTFFIQEKNRLDLLDYIRALCYIGFCIALLWAIAFYGFNWR
jgi:hypothetical protein